MYSINHTDSIELDYYSITTRRISNDMEYEFQGKSNQPNLMLLDGIKRISFVTNNITFGSNEMIIHHTSTSNYPRKALVIIPLETHDTAQRNDIDSLIQSDYNEAIDINLNEVIKNYSVEINKSNNDIYVIRLETPVIIQSNLSSVNIQPQRAVVIEGACGMSKKQKRTLKTLGDKMNTLGNKVSNLQDGLNDLKGDVTTHIDNTADAHHGVSINDRPDGTMLGLAGFTTMEAKTPVIEGLEIDNKFNPLNEVECYPEIGTIFNKVFAIVYDDNDNSDFVSETVMTDSTTREAINDRILEIKVDMQNIGGIYNHETLEYDSGARATNESEIMAISTKNATFNDDTIDYVIRYYRDDGTGKIKNPPIYDDKDFIKLDEKLVQTSGSVEKHVELEADNIINWSDWTENSNTEKIDKMIIVIDTKTHKLYNYETFKKHIMEDQDTSEPGNAIKQSKLEVQIIGLWSFIAMIIIITYFRLFPSLYSSINNPKISRIYISFCIILWGLSILFFRSVHVWALYVLIGIFGFTLTCITLIHIYYRNDESNIVNLNQYTLADMQEIWDRMNVLFNAR